MYRDPNFQRLDERELQRRVQNMIVRGTVRSVDDALKMQALGVTLENGFRASKVEHWHPYGMSYFPQEGAEVLAFALRGDRDHLVILPGADRRFRLKNFAPGEMAIHDDQGQKVHFQRGGIMIESSKPVTIKAPTVKIEGNIEHTGNMTTTGVHVDANGPHTA